MNIDLASTGSLERLADLIRQQHPSLDIMLLSPVEGFRTRTVALGKLMLRDLSRSQRSRHIIPSLSFNHGAAQASRRL